MFDSMFSATFDILIKILGPYLVIDAITRLFHQGISSFYKISSLEKWLFNHPREMGPLIISLFFYLFMHPTIYISTLSHPSIYSIDLTNFHLRILLAPSLSLFSFSINP